MKKNSLILTASLFAVSSVFLVWMSPWSEETTTGEVVSEAPVDVAERGERDVHEAASAENPAMAEMSESESKPVLRRRSAVADSDTHLPGFPGVQYEEILFEEASEANDEGRFERVRVVRTDYHYPHLRVTEHFRNNPETGEAESVGWHAMVADHVIARIDADLSNQQIEAMFADRDIQVRRRMDEQGLYLLEFPIDGIDAVDAALARVSREEDVVLYAEPDQIVTPAAIDPPNDPWFDEQWALHNTGQQGFFLETLIDPLFGDISSFGIGGGRSGADIDALRGWEIRTDASDVVVAVLDTGVNFNHEDLRGNMWRNPREREDQTDTSGSGFIDDIFGVDVTTGGVPMDGDGHGTHVAGTIGALGNNNIGVTGVAWDVQLMAVRFLVPVGTISGSILSYDYARLNGAHVVNASFGGFFFSRAEKEAIDRLRKAGIVVVAAAGNDGKNIDIFEHFYPARYDLDNIVRVGASDRRDQPATFSNFGPEEVDIFAPGVDIISTSIPNVDLDPLFGQLIMPSDNSTYAYLDGTSMAAPHVSGILALIAAEYPGEDYETRINRLLAGARVEPEFFGEVVRESRFANLFGPLSQGDAPILFTPLQDIDFTEGETVTLSVAAAARPEPFYTWYHDGEELVGETGSSLTVENMDATDAGIYEVVVSNVPNPGLDDDTVASAARLRFNPGNPVLGLALGAPELQWTSSEDYPWEQAGEGEGLRSFPGLGDDESSKLVVNAHGPLTISFEWRVSSERIYDVLRFRVNGEERHGISGQSGWEPITVHLPDAGPYQLSWSYEKDLVGSQGQDAGWVRNVAFSPHFPHIVEQPRDQEVVEGGTARFRVAASGDPSPSYRWYRDGERVEGADRNVLTVTSADASDAGLYHAVVWNSHGQVRTVSARLSVVEEANQPVIVTDPQTTTVSPGEIVLLEVGYQGTSPVQVQWHKEGVGAISGATSDTLLLHGVGEEDAGTYFAVVSNDAGEATTQTATVTVLSGDEGEDALPAFAEVADSREAGIGLYEYATGTGRLPQGQVIKAEPIRPTASRHGTTQVTIGGERYFGLAFDRSRHAPGVSFHLEASGDLEDWKEVPAVLEVIGETNKHADRVLLREEEPASGETVRFLRLRVRYHSE